MHWPPSAALGRSDAKVGELEWPGAVCTLYVAVRPVIMNEDLTQLGPALASSWCTASSAH